MQIDVLDKNQAVCHIPKVPTIAMRIHGSPNTFIDDKAYLPLVESGLYVASFSYVFDDVRPKDCIGNEVYRRYYLLFGDDDAKRVIEDFIRTKERAEALMVHCFAGRGRSAGVASGLEDIFSLGNPSKPWETESVNLHVYEILLSVARRMKVGIFS